MHLHSDTSVLGGYITEGDPSCITDGTITIIGYVSSNSVCVPYLGAYVAHFRIVNFAFWLT